MTTGNHGSTTLLAYLPRFDAKNGGTGFTKCAIAVIIEFSALAWWDVEVSSLADAPLSLRYEKLAIYLYLVGRFLTFHPTIGLRRIPAFVLFYIHLRN